MLQSLHLLEWLVPSGLVLGRLDEREPEALATARFGPHLVSGDDIVFATTMACCSSWDGRRYAEELGEPPTDGDEPPFRREVVALAPLDAG